MRRAFLVLLLIVLITAGLIWWLLGRQQADPAYAPQVTARTWSQTKPIVVIDDKHWNVHTATRGYGPFARLLTADGYTLLDIGSASLIDVLPAADVLVVANPLGIRGVVRQLGQIAGLALDALQADAISPAEADAIEAWVREGGALLLVADHAPAGRAAQSLAARFDVMMQDGFVLDPDHADGPSGYISFTRNDRTLGRHPIIEGASPTERVNKVVTFTGQALRGPPQAVPLLLFSPTAFEIPSAREPENRRTVARLSQALALTHGLGRVVVLGEAAVMTSQLVTGGGETNRIGLAWPGADNERFARNVMGWLSRAGE